MDWAYFASYEAYGCVSDVGQKGGGENGKIYRGVQYLNFYYESDNG